MLERLKLGGDPFETPPEGLVQALERGASRTRARKLPTSREIRAPKLRQHEARQVLPLVRFPVAWDSGPRRIHRVWGLVRGLVQRRRRH